MTAPADNAKFEYLVELFLNGAWRDITADVQGSITIKRGLTPEGRRADPGTCSMRLNNLSGDYSPRNPAGQWYGHLGRNTPLRVSAGLAGGTLVGRFHGEVPSWPPGWNINGTVRWVDIEASGILRRLGQGEQPVWSPLRRSIEGSDPAAYWPIEDGTLAESAGSGVSGAPPLTVTGSVEFKPLGEYDAYAAAAQVFGTFAMANLAAGGSLQAALPSDATAATAGPHTVFVLAAPESSTTLSADLVLMEWTTSGGTFRRWRLVITTAARTRVIAYDSAGAATTVIDHPSATVGFTTYAVSVSPNGANIDVDVYTNGTAPYASGSVAGTLSGGVVTISCNPTGTTSTAEMPFGQLAVWAADAPPIRMGSQVDDYGNSVFEARRAYGGEDAVDRLTRLCDEAGIALAVTAASDYEATPMGWQPAAALADLLDECADADHGMLYESRDALGLAYRPRATLYNQTPATIAYTGQLAPPFEPLDDADRVRNDITVKRTDGSSARAVQATGPLAAAAPPDGVGVYRTQVELNLNDDSPLPDHAGWLLHLGTVDQERYPALSVQLASPEWQADPSGVAALLAVDSGDVLEVDGLPSWAAGDVRTMVTGYTETFDEWLWSITFAGNPAKPWDVAEVDGDARVAADGSTLAATLTDADVVPASAWTFTAGVEGWTALNGTVAWNSVLEALTFTPNGSSSSGEPRSPNTPGVGSASWWYATALVSCAVSRTVNISLLWRDAGGALLSTTTAAFALTAGVQQRLSVVGQAPASTAQAMIALPMGGTPPASHVLTVYEADLTPLQSLSLASTVANGVWTTDPADMPLDVRVGAERVRVVAISGTSSPQTARVSARGLNGVRRSWSAGTEVDVWFPAIVAL